MKSQPRFTSGARVRSLWSLTLLLMACVTVPPAREVPAPRPLPREEPRHACDPAGSREPVATDGGVCGDGRRGQRCQSIRVFGCGMNSESLSCEAPEVCDEGDLGGATCQTIGLSGNGLRCGSGCAMFDHTGCDACPRRPGVRCQPLGLQKTMTPHTFAVAPGGAVAVLNITDSGSVTLAISERGEVIKVLKPLAGHDPRQLVAVAPGRFVYVTETYDAVSTKSDRVVAVPFSAREGLGKPIEVLRQGDVRVQAATVVEGVPLVITFTAGRWDSWSVHALTASGTPRPLPEGRTFVVFARFTPELAILREKAGTTIVSLPNNGGACVASVRRDDTAAPLRSSGASSFEHPDFGTLSAAPEGARCRARWTHPDGTVTLLGQVPPPMQGVEDWQRDGAGWLGERQGVLLTVDPLEFR